MFFEAWGQLSCSSGWLCLRPCSPTGGESRAVSGQVDRGPVVVPVSPGPRKAVAMPCRFRPSPTKDLGQEDCWQQSLLGSVGIQC